MEGLRDLPLSSLKVLEKWFTKYRGDMAWREMAVRHELMRRPMITKIISGGQTGADQGGLKAGKILGIETGGTAAGDFYTESGRNEALRSVYGLEKGPGKGEKALRERTRMNVGNSDFTVLFGNPSSPGSRLTIAYCENLNKICVRNPNAKELAIFIQEHPGFEIMNVAGNRESKNSGIYNSTKEVIIDAIRNYERYVRSIGVSDLVEENRPSETA